MSKIEKAISSFGQDYNCAQSILIAYSTEYGLDQNIALKLSTGFGGGMGRMQNTCGAVSGAFMVIGLKHGMGINVDNEAKEKTYQVIQEFSNRFQELHGSIICKELLGFDFNTLEEKDLDERKKIFEEKCFQYVKDSAKILEDIL